MAGFAFFLVQCIDKSQEYSNKQGNCLVSADHFFVWRRIFNYVIDIFADYPANCGTNCQPGCQIPVD